MMRGIRGAIGAESDSKDAIFAATSELLQTIFEKNNFTEDDIASIFLTATPDLTADYPAYAVRENGMTQVPVLCATEIDVPGGMSKVIRALVHVNTDKTQREIVHVYLGRAAALRPDLSGGC